MWQVKKKKPALNCWWFKNDTTRRTVCSVRREKQPRLWEVQWKRCWSSIELGHNKWSSAQPTWGHVLSAEGVGGGQHTLLRYLQALTFHLSKCPPRNNKQNIFPPPPPFSFFEVVIKTRKILYPCLTKQFNWNWVNTNASVQISVFITFFKSCSTWPLW